MRAGAAARQGTRLDGGEALLRCADPRHQLEPGLARRDNAIGAARVAPEYRNLLRLPRRIVSQDAPSRRCRLPACDSDRLLYTVTYSGRPLLVVSAEDESEALNSAFAFIGVAHQAKRQPIDEKSERQKLGLRAPIGHELVQWAQFAKRFGSHPAAPAAMVIKRPRPRLITGGK
jgi:hypothetical protein